MSNWIEVSKEYPEEDEIVVAWLAILEEPCCVKFNLIDGIAHWEELLEVRIDPRRKQSGVTHWMRMRKPNK
jgi:hypothetical protein